jgi:membrane associated rhomboid family serine protease
MAENEIEGGEAERAFADTHKPSLERLKVEQEPIKKREPIFNQTPMGVAILTGVILTAHIVSLLAGGDARLAAVLRFGVTPVDILGHFDRHEYLTALTPLIAHQFIHGGTLHLVMNLAMLLQAGPIAELGLSRNRDSVARFIILFLSSGICGALLFCWLNPSSTGPTIGASGAISGVFAGFLWAAIGLAKPGQAMLRPVVTSAIVFLLINVGLAWVGRALNVVPIAWESHLGGFLGGLLLYPIIARAGRSQHA